MSLRLSFYGGAGKVTGSHFLVEGAQGKVLVDCGAEQGADLAAADAHEPFPYDPKSVDALVVTHAHLDHVGRIPKLVRDGFRGKIYMTPPTRDLAVLILLDSAHILAEEAARLGREPLFGAEDVEAAFALVETLEYHTEKEVAPGLSVYLRNTGHILGSASVRIRSEEGAAVALTGDIGNSPSPLLPDWEPVTDADALVMESVYGDKTHPAQERRVELLRDALAKAIERGGAILIPAFSLERTQLMLYELSNFFAEASLPQIPVFLDSPLAIRVTEVYEKWGMTYFKPDAESEMKREGSLFEFPFLKKTLSREDSAAIERVPGPKIIVAGAGMSHGGRIREWEARYLPDPSTTLFMIGYQAPGTPGRRMMEGAASVRLGGAEIRIRARVEHLEGWSGHADRDGLLAFAESCLSPRNGGRPTSPVTRRLKTIFTALGEPAAERHLAQRIHDYLGARAIASEAGTAWLIDKTGAKKI